MLLVVAVAVAVAVAVVVDGCHSGWFVVVMIVMVSAPPVFMRPNI